MLLVLLPNEVPDATLTSDVAPVKHAILATLQVCTRALAALPKYMLNGTLVAGPDVASLLCQNRCRMERALKGRAADPRSGVSASKCTCQITRAAIWCTLDFSVTPQSFTLGKEPDYASSWPLVGVSYHLKRVMFVFTQ